MEQQIKIDYAGKYVEVRFAYDPRLTIIMQNAPAAQWNRYRRCWQMPPNDITIKWTKDFEILWPGIKVERSKKFIKFIETRESNVNAVINCRKSISRPLASVDNADYKLKPYPHQLEALRFLMRRIKIGKNFAALFYEMGLGKTKIVIDFMKLTNSKTALIVVPKTLSYSWRKEIEKNLGTKKIAVLDATRGQTKSRAWKIAQMRENSALRNYKRIVLINYDALRNDSLLSTLLDYQWSIIALDESTYIKNIKAKRTKAAIKLGEKADFKILMTGTPITNSYVDLFAPLQFLSSEILGIPTFTAFKATYAVMGGFKAKQIVSWKNLDDLMSKVRLHSLIATLDECLDKLPKAMPPKIRTVSLEDHSDIRDAYNSMRKELIHIFTDGTEVTAPNVLTRCLRLQQITSGFLTDESKKIIPIAPPPKIEPLIETISELGDQEKVIIGARFHYDIEQIKKALAPFGKIEIITGKITGKKRDKAVESFEQDPEARFLVGTPKTFGYGLTFIKTRYIVWYSPNFSLEERKQTNARIRRPGQKRRAVYIDLACENTIDELIITALMKKGDLLDYVMDIGSKIAEVLPEI